MRCGCVWYGIDQLQSNIMQTKTDSAKLASPAASDKVSSFTGRNKQSRLSLSGSGDVAEIEDLQVNPGIGGSAHSYSTGEKAGFSNHINQCLEGEQILAHLLPLDPSSNDLFEKNSDGLILGTSKQ